MRGEGRHAGNTGAGSQIKSVCAGRTPPNWCTDQVLSTAETLPNQLQWADGGGGAVHGARAAGERLAAPQKRKSFSSPCHRPGLMSYVRNIAYGNQDACWRRRYWTILRTCRELQTVGRGRFGAARCRSSLLPERSCLFWQSAQSILRLRACVRWHSWYGRRFAHQASPTKRETGPAVVAARD